MTDRIVVVTKAHDDQNRPFRKNQLESHFALLEKHNMQPQWMRRKRHSWESNPEYLIVRPVYKGDPKEIIQSLTKLLHNGWTFTNGHERKAKRQNP